MYMSSMYTEPLFAFLVYRGMNLFFDYNQILSGLWFGLSSFCRSNGILNAGYFAHLLISHLTSTTRKFDYKAILKQAFGVILCFAGLVVFEYYGYVEYCSDARERPWCTRSLPLIYSFVQDHYWNNGFLRYYQFKQLPNFIFAFPMIYLSYRGIREYFRPMSICWRELKVQVKSKKLAKSYHNPQMFPIIVLWIFMLVYCVLFMHVQVITRFMTSMPAVYWFGAHLILNKKKIGRMVVYYFIIYGLTTCLTFSLFLPPA